MFDPLNRRRRPSKSVLAVLTLACLTAITVDYQRDESSPFEPARGGGPMNGWTSRVSRLDADGVQMRSEVA